MKNIRKISVTAFIVVLVIILYIVTKGSYLEYKELGEKYLSVFKINLTYKYSIMVINFIIVFLIMYISNRGIKKGLKVFFDEEKKDVPKLPNKSIALIISAISSIVVSVTLTPKVILYASNVSFEKTDLIFNLDISFYMFMEPLIKMALLYVIGIFAFLTIYSAIYYILVFNKYFDGIDKEMLKNSYLIKHLSRYIRFIAIFFSAFTIVKTLDIVFNKFITTGTGLQLTGAGKVDINIKIVANIILAIVLVISIFLATSKLKKGERTKMLKSIAIVPIYFVFMFLIMFGYDIIFVNSNEYDKEKEYIERNLSYTKQAYGINAEDETITYSGAITNTELENNKKLLDSIVITTKEMALDKLNTEQSEKGYYTYQTAGISKYKKGEKTELVYISPREISSNKRTYNSKTFEYTHGYGAIFTSATNVTEDGSIEYIDNDISSTNYIKRPQIYYGIKTDSFVAANENENKEFDYTDSKGIEHTSSYKGNSGLQLSFFDKLILGTKTGNINLALSGGINQSTRVLINRNIRKRAKLVLSEVIYDENPYIVINNEGKMYWVLDGYTISNNYPYSTYTTINYDGEKRDINYIRNSIKVLINCYDGEMKFYITDTTDPIAMAYNKMYPKVFEDLNSVIPEDISENFIYPKFLYDVQSSMLEEYHNTKSEVLYRGDDSWKKAAYVATQNNRSINKTLDSYYTMVKEENIGLVQMYTPSGKQNLTGYLVGISENGKNKLKIYRLSSNESILGLVQLDSKIAEDENMEKEIEELNVTGAKITKNIMIIPVENTILYVEKIYQTKTNESDLPFLKKVIVASGNKVAIGNNLEQALKNIVSQEATKIDTYSTENVEDLIQSVIKANKNLKNSMNSKNWELMGSDIESLQELIDKLEAEKKKEDEQKNKNLTTNIIPAENTIQN